MRYYELFEIWWCLAKGFVVEVDFKFFSGFQGFASAGTQTQEKNHLFCSILHQLGVLWDWWRVVTGCSVMPANTPNSNVWRGPEVNLFIPAARWDSASGVQALLKVPSDSKHGHKLFFHWTCRGLTKKKLFQAHQMNSVLNCRESWSDRFERRAGEQATAGSDVSQVAGEQAGGCAERQADTS